MFLPSITLTLNLKTFYVWGWEMGRNIAYTCEGGGEGEILDKLSLKSY